MRILTLSILAFVLFNSCSTELDVNADFRETPIMFALINQNDSINYIRLQKAFSNENGNALEIAQEFDSLYYDSTKVQLSLVERNIQTGDADTVEILRPEYNEDKVPGEFAAPGQYVYKTTYNDFKQEDYEYIFRFENFETGLVATAKTDIVGCQRILSPVRYSCTTESFTGGLRRALDVNEDGSGDVLSFNEFNGPANAAFFSCEAVVEYTVKYEDDDRDLDTVSTAENVWTVLNLDLDERVTGKQYGENGALPIGQTSFGSYLARVIDVSQDESLGIVERNLLSIQFKFYYYNTSYENFLEVNGNFNPLSQTKPLYTNVVNGLGLVASRSILESPKLGITTFSNLEDPNYFKAWPELKFPFLDE